MYGKTYKLHNSAPLAPAEVLLVSSSPAFDGLHDDIFILAYFYRKLLKKRRSHGEHEPTIVVLKRMGNFCKNTIGKSESKLNLRINFTLV